MQGIYPRPSAGAASCATAFLADGCGGRSRGGPPRGRPETFHRSRGAQLHSAASRPASGLGSRKGRATRERQRARANVFLPSGCTVTLQNLQLTSESSNSNFMKLTVNFMKLEIKLLKVTPYLAEVNPHPRAKNARHIPTTQRGRGLVRHCVSRRWLRWKVSGRPLGEAAPALGRGYMPCIFGAGARVDFC